MKGMIVQGLGPLTPSEQMEPFEPDLSAVETQLGSVASFTDGFHVH